LSHGGNGTVNISRGDECGQTFLRLAMLTQTQTQEAGAEEPDGCWDVLNRPGTDLQCKQKTAPQRTGFSQSRHYQSTRLVNCLCVVLESSCDIPLLLPLYCPWMESWAWPCSAACRHPGVYYFSCSCSSVLMPYRRLRSISTQA